MTIGKKIKQKRLELNMSQSMLAKASGLKQQSISEIELGIIKKTRNIIELAKALKCSAESLYDNNGE